MALISLSARFDVELFGCYSEVRRHLLGALVSLTSSLADKSMSILLGRPICLRDEDCTVHFPKELDDE